MTYKKVNNKHANGDMRKVTHLIQQKSRTVISNFTNLAAR